jgi:hypothetical protein
MLFVAHQNDRARVDMDGLAEDFSRKKIQKKGKMLKRHSLLETDSSVGDSSDSYMAVLYRTVPDPAVAAADEEKKKPKADRGSGGRGLFDPCWNNGKSCWLLATASEPEAKSTD